MKKVMLKNSRTLRYA